MNEKSLVSVPQISIIIRTMWEVASLQLPAEYPQLSAYLTVNETNKPFAGFLPHRNNCWSLGGPCTKGLGGL